MKTIGAVCNAYNEALSLPGWLEKAVSFFDDVRVYHSGPAGKMSDDGTLEILKKWNVEVVHGDISGGFGKVRTAAVRTSPCDYVMLMDCDERFWPIVQRLDCGGESPVPPVAQQVLQPYDTPTEGAVPWNLENLHLHRPGVEVYYAGVYDQGSWLRDLIQHDDYDALVLIRRHWLDFSWKRPAQNWRTFPDWQARIVRNHPSVYWTGKLHEKLEGAKKVREPDRDLGPFVEHLHLPLRGMVPAKRAADIETYLGMHDS